jgi:uncharacterized protein YjbI with pentapeptide repeats
MMESTIHEDKQFEKQSYADAPYPVAEHEECQFEACDFSNTDLSGSSFSDCVFDGCQFSMNGPTVPCMNWISAKQTLPTQFLKVVICKGAFFQAPIWRKQTWVPLLIIA